MAGLVALIYGIVIYAVFFASFLYTIGFVGNFAVPKTIDNGVQGPLMVSLLIDSVLIGLFAVQHSVMARSGFKARWTKIVPPAVERSTYVLFSTLALCLLCWQWRSILVPVWSVTNDVGATMLMATFWLGWAIVLISTFLINHFELFGLRQVYARYLGKGVPPSTFRTPLFYRFVRHPLYFGFLLAIWATPAMTLGHLLFALGLTVYIFIGMSYEERDLIKHFGAQYESYRARVSLILPLPPRRG